jgi:uncharacterized protein YbaR (Trm112 family)
MNAITSGGINDTRDTSEKLQLVDGPKLLEILFQPECRPTLRWLRDQQRARRIPYVKIGRLVFFSPEQVRRALERLK